MLLIKWTKTLQDHKSYHILQLPKIKNLFLCCVKALRALLGSRPFPPSAPLFSTYGRSPNQILDMQVQEALKKVLLHLNIHLKGHSFHAFRRSDATYVSDRNVSLQNIMSHGFWRSSAVWFYLQNAFYCPSNLCFLHPFSCLVGLGLSNSLYEFQTCVIFNNFMVC